MGKLRVQAIMCLAVTLPYCACAFALDPSLDISQYAHTAWRVRDGFAKGFIYSIAQTPDGYIWLGTEFGLLRFDGERAVVWKAPAGQQLPSTDVPKLLVTRDGALWIGTTKGLASWKEDKLTAYTELNGVGISALHEGQDGTIWIATREPRIIGQNVGPIDADPEGNFWLRLEKGSGKWKAGRPELSTPRAENWPAVRKRKKSGLAISRDRGMQDARNSLVHNHSTSGSSAQSKTPPTLRDRDGGVWIGTEQQGLVHLHRGRTDVFSEADGLSGDTITDLLQDLEGDIWVVTTNGIDRFREYAIPNVGVKQGLSNSKTLSILASKDGDVWIGTYNGLNRWRDGHVSLWEGGGGSFHGSVYSLFQETDGRIWAATLTAFGYLESNRFVPVLHLRGGWAFSVAEVPAGHLWVAVDHDHGLFHLFKGRVVETIPWAGLGHRDHARVLLGDPSGHGLWLGFDQGGVSYFANGRIQESYSAAAGLGAGRVNALRFGPHGGLWVATEHGLSRIKNGHITSLASENGLPCDTVHWSIDDADHFVWVYTACGMVRIARPEVDAWIDDPARTVTATLFDVSDGVRTHSSPSPGQGMTRALDGKIWYVALDGVSIIDPRHFSFNKVPPPVHIEQIRADGTVYSASNGLRLPPRVRDLAIDYTGLSLADPAKVHFRYTLEGQDSDWREVVNDRQVQYSNLSPGKYRFRVKACNNSGLWNEQGAALEFLIPPAWYQTNWFRALCAASVLIMLCAAHQLRVRQLAQQFNLTLEARVAERTRIARDLHDTLLQSFQALLPRLQAAIYKLPEGAAGARKILEEAADGASEAITEARHAVQGLRLSTVEQNDLARSIRTVGEVLTSAETNQFPPHFRVVVEGASRNLHPILRDEVYRLAAEALRNAFRHAAAQNVEVEIRYDESYLRIRVRDDGKGIRDEVLRGDLGAEGHYGLRGMRERARLVNGKLTIWSEGGSGTEVELIIPASSAYARPTRRFWYLGKRPAPETDAKESDRA